VSGGDRLAIQAPAWEGDHQGTPRLVECLPRATGHVAPLHLLSRENPFFNVVVAISTGIDAAARHGNADFGLRVILTYVDINGTVQTLDSGPLSIKLDTIQVASIDSRTNAIALQLPLQAAPGPNPSYSATAELLHP
jgi:hypothetical protein